MFETIKNEENGKLDVLVNNVYAGVNMIIEDIVDWSNGQEIPSKTFWDSDPFEMWDCVNGVGLRNHYCCTALASK